MPFNRNDGTGAAPLPGAGPTVRLLRETVDTCRGIVVWEYQTSVGPADYALFSVKRALGVVEAKPDSWGAKITTVEDQSAGYAAAQLRWVKNPEPLPFIYEATGQITRFTDTRDPNPGRGRSSPFTSGDT